MPGAIIWFPFYNISVKMKSLFTNLLQRIWKGLDKDQILSIDIFDKFSLNNW